MLHRILNTSFDYESTYRFYLNDYFFQKRPVFSIFQISCEKKREYLITLNSV